MRSGWGGVGKKKREFRGSKSKELKTDHRLTSLLKSSLRNPWWCGSGPRDHSFIGWRRKANHDAYLKANPRLDWIPTAEKIEGGPLTALLKEVFSRPRLVEEEALVFSTYNLVERADRDNLAKAERSLLRVEPLRAEVPAAKPRNVKKTLPKADSDEKGVRRNLPP